MILSVTLSVKKNNLPEESVFMKRFTISTLMVVMFLSLLATSAFAAAPDFQQLGFAKVVAEKTIDPAQATSITYGEVNIDIPEGAFKNPVKFQVLEGPLADFQKKTPKGETVLMNFAFKVTDTTTDELIGKFEKPVIFSYTNDKVTSESKYYDTLQDGEFSLNKVPAKIEGSTLSHPIAGAPVGWAVTSPESTSAVKDATSPVTGLDMTKYMMSGMVLLIAGFILAFMARRRTN